MKIFSRSSLYSTENFSVILDHYFSWSVQEFEKPPSGLLPISSNLCIFSLISAKIIKGAHQFNPLSTYSRSIPSFCGIYRSVKEVVSVVQLGHHRLAFNIIHGIPRSFIADRLPKTIGSFEL